MPKSTQCAQYAEAVFDCQYRVFSGFCYVNNSKMAVTKRNESFQHPGTKFDQSLRSTPLLARMSLYISCYEDMRHCVR